MSLYPSFPIINIRQAFPINVSRMFRDQWYNVCWEFWRFWKKSTISRQWTTLIQIKFLLARPDHTELGPHENSRRWFGQRYTLELHLGQGMEGAEKAKENVEAHCSSVQTKPPKPHPGAGAKSSVRETVLSTLGLAYWFFFFERKISSLYL